MGSDRQSPTTTTLIFAVPVFTTDGIDSDSADVQASVMANMKKLCEDAAVTTSCQISFDLKEVSITQQDKGSRVFSFVMSVFGPHEQSMAAKGILLRRNPSQVRGDCFF
jgi:hypothetical protein